MAEKILQLNTEKNIFRILITAFIFCAVFYIYLINVTIRNVVTRENLENKISELSLTIGNKEFQYISLRNGITLSMAHSLGFRDIKEKTYISNKIVSYASYLNTN
jgi:hypothetical protein